MRSAAVILIAALAVGAEEAIAQEPPKEPAAAQPLPQMPDDVRGAISRIVILPTAGESGESITGTYDQETLGLSGGYVRIPGTVHDEKGRQRHAGGQAGQLAQRAGRPGEIGTLSHGGPDEL